MENKSPWKVIFYENESAEGIIDSEHYFDEPTTEGVESLMKELNSPYAQMYYDKYDSEEYDELVCEYTL
jgi:hypothetical protein